MPSPEASLAVAATTRQAEPRDARLDCFRGLALATIFINHVPGTPYEDWTSRNFGFSDAAEAFFVMSGVAAALAYSGRFRAGASGGYDLRQAVAPIWSRAWTLYLVHLALSVWAMGILAGAATLFDLPELARTNNLRVLFDDPLGLLVGIPLLTHQLGYVNILPVYAVLLLATPVMIAVARRRPAALLAGAITLWFVAGSLRLNFPAWPNPGGWFFNPFAWQLPFVVGLLVGVAMKEGRRFVAVDARWVLIAAAFLALALLWREVPPVGGWFDRQLWKLGRLGVPFHLVGHDKTFLALPRLLHVLALVYVLSASPAVRRLAAAPASGGLRLLGRQGLLVFSLGTVLAIAGQALLAAAPRDPWRVYGIVPLGLAMLLGASWLAERAAAKRRAGGENGVSSDAAPTTACGVRPVPGS